MHNRRRKKEFFYKCKLWNEQFIAGKYKEDEDMMKFLFDYQMDEMQASNYYMLDLKEEEDFSFDEIDAKKVANLTRKDKEHDISYKMFIEMYGKYSDLKTPKVDYQMK